MNGPEAAVSCTTGGLPLHVFTWRAEYGEAGFALDGLYLIRPDTYIALAAPSTGPGAVARYFADRRIQF